MRHVPSGDLPWHSADRAHFTGEVRTARLAARDEDLATMVAVHFEGRARTFWHSHPGGQVLWVITGQAVVGTNDGSSVVAGPGDTVIAPPDELHWHGAATEEPMVHLSITADDGALWTSQGVEDQQYQEACS